MISNRLYKKILKITFSDISLITCKHRHFTFIAKRNIIISYGYNQIFKSHPIANKFSHRFSDIHSELAAILHFPYPIKELKNYNIINLRIRRDNNQLGLSRPCQKCFRMLNTFGINEVYYSNGLGGFSYEIIN